MNLLLVGNHFSESYGNQNVWQNFAKQLRLAGHIVLTTSGKKNRLLRLFEMLTTIYSHRDQYQVAEVDVFSGQAFTWAYMSAMLLKKMGKPVILTLHGGNLPEYSRRNTKKVQRLLHNVTAVVAPSGYLMQNMRPYRDDILLIPNALDISLYPFRQRKKLKPNLIWLRSFHQIYNPELAPQIIASILPSFPEVQLFMVGSDKGDGSLQRTQKIAVDLDIANHCNFPGPVPKKDVPTWLNKGDIFINTTNVDNTPISILEAMACGMCIVSTNVGGIPYLLEDGKDGILVPPNNPHSMSDAVRLILSNPDLASRLSEAARKKAEQFDWTNVLPMWEELLRSLE